ncbi:hypothetical protein LINPERHAP2_LOCUS23316 [Linum perenne]
MSRFIILRSSLSLSLGSAALEDAKFVQNSVSSSLSLKKHKALVAVSGCSGRTPTSEYEFQTLLDNSSTLKLTLWMAESLLSQWSMPRHTSMSGVPFGRTLLIFRALSLTLGWSQVTSTQ